MSDLILLHPVRTLDNQELLPAGTQLSAEIINELVSKARSVSYQKHSLLQSGSIRKDILRFINRPPYNVIFSDNEVKDDLLNFMENVHLVTPVIQTLDYFKENDSYTYHHILSVFALCVRISKVMMSDHWVRLNEAASGPLHDIGKICVPMNLLKKVSPLTQEERSIIEHHSIAGYILLSYYSQDAGSIFAGIARDHHERRDGSGYPRGIKLNDHLVELIAVCDVYDALISPRPYRSSSYDNRTAIEVITEMGENSVLDREIIKALVSINRKVSMNYSECKVSLEKRGKAPLYNSYGVSKMMIISHNLYFVGCERIPF
jgi:HD-GYP domain-containing protein (c-di-GMP phosphodiesterase class II)